MSSSSGMASNPTRRVSCRSRSLSLVCKIPISLLGFLETSTVGYYQGIFSYCPSLASRYCPIPVAAKP
jgi:hypothetical protein